MVFEVHKGAKSDLHEHLSIKVLKLQHRSCSRRPLRPQHAQLRYKKVVQESICKLQHIEVYLQNSEVKYVGVAKGAFGSVKN